MYPQTKSFRPARKNSGSPWRNAKPPEATTSNQSCEWAIRDAARAPATSKWTPRPAHRLARTCGSCAANEARGAALPWDSRQSATSQNADQRSRMGHREIQTVNGIAGSAQTTSPHTAGRLDETRSGPYVELA